MLEIVDLAKFVFYRRKFDNKMSVLHAHTRVHRKRTNSN